MQALTPKLCQTSPNQGDVLTAAGGEDFCTDLFRQRVSRARPISPLKAALWAPLPARQQVLRWQLSAGSRGHCCKLCVPFIGTMRGQTEGGRHYALLKKKLTLVLRLVSKQRKRPQKNPLAMSEAVLRCSLMGLGPLMAEKIYSPVSPRGCLKHSKWTRSV